MSPIRVLISKSLRDSAFLDSHGDLITEYLYTQARLEQLQNSFRLRKGSVPIRKWGSLFSLWNVRVAILGFGRKNKAPAPASAQTQAPARSQPSQQVFQAPAQTQAPARPRPPVQTQTPVQTQEDSDPRNTNKDPEKIKKDLIQLFQSYGNASDAGEMKRIILNIKGYYNTPSLKEKLDQLSAQWKKIQSEAKVDPNTGQPSSSGVSVGTLKKKYKEGYRKFVQSNWVKELVMTLLKSLGEIGQPKQKADKTEFKKKKKKPTSPQEQQKERQEQETQRMIENAQAYGLDLGGGSPQEQAGVAEAIFNQSEDPFSGLTEDEIEFNF